MSAKHNSEKLISLTLVIAILAVSVAIFTYLQVAFGSNHGFSGPPPGAPGTSTGALTALNGNLGVYTDNPSTTLTVSGVISAIGNQVKDVANATENKDAVNLGQMQTYVAAQTSSGGGGSFTMFNVTTELIGNGGPSGGQGVPACPSGYSEVVAGYGPHAYITAFGWGPIGAMGFDDPLPDPDGYVDPVVSSGSFSICSNSKYHIWPTLVPMAGAGGQNYIRADACTQYSLNEAICNTCRVCAKGLDNPIGPYGSVPPDTR